jgi:hypothetical protein
MIGNTNPDGKHSGAGPSGFYSGLMGGEKFKAIAKTTIVLTIRSLPRTGFGDRPITRKKLSLNRRDYIFKIFMPWDP